MHEPHAVGNSINISTDECESLRVVLFISVAKQSRSVDVGNETSSNSGGALIDFAVVDSVEKLIWLARDVLCQWEGKKIQPFRGIQEQRLPRDHNPHSSLRCRLVGT